MLLSSKTLAGCGEFLGTAFLVAGIVGSGIMAERLTENAAVALLANAIATGALLVVLITLFAPLSDAHFNPAISALEVLEGRLSFIGFVRYATAQTAGAVAGVFGAHAMFGLRLLQASGHVRSGFAQAFSEGVATFGLTLLVLRRFSLPKEQMPWLIGLYILAAYWFTASTSFANPAVTIARSLTNTFSGIRPVDVPAFILAQAIGAAAALGFSRLLGKQREAYG